MTTPGMLTIGFLGRHLEIHLYFPSTSKAYRTYNEVISGTTLARSPMKHLLLLFSNFLRISYLCGSLFLVFHHHVYSPKTNYPAGENRLTITAVDYLSKIFYKAPNRGYLTI